MRSYKLSLIFLEKKIIIKSVYNYILKYKHREKKS